MPACPILVVSINDVVMYPPVVTPDAHDSTLPVPHPTPFVAMRPRETSAGQRVRPRTRLIFHEIIPELGVFVAASAHGEVYVFRLTQTHTVDEGYAPRAADTRADKAASPASGSPASAWAKFKFRKACFGFRLEHVLPSRERLGGRDDFWADGGVYVRRLVGLAVAPMQDELGPAETDQPHAQRRGRGGVPLVAPRRRRWRLMVSYHDHSVLSYALGWTPAWAADGVEDDVLDF